MTRASKLNLAGTVWSVKEVAPETLEEIMEYECEAGICLTEQTIYLNRDLHPHRKAVALVHEALHLIYDRSGYQVPQEEKNIMALDHGVYELINKFPKKYRGL